jgi:hypothetical protein
MIDRSTTGAPLALCGCMAPVLGTTNLFLGIMAVVSLLQVAGSAPAGARVQAILDDVKDVTTTIKTNAARG